MLRRVMTVVTCVAGLFSVQPVWAQPTPEETIDHLEGIAEFGKSLKNQLGERGHLLSSGALHIVTLGAQWETLKPRLKRAVERRRFSANNNELEVQEKALAPKAGSDPLAKSDFFTRLGGLTQSETTVAWCGNNVAIGFNDSGSYTATLLPFIDSSLPPSPSKSGSLSFNGWSISTNGGVSFKDRGVLVADPLPPKVKYRDLGGDPVIRCANETTFYYASLATDTLASDKLLSGISVSKSTDGGNTWGGAVMAVSKDQGTDNNPMHFLDKDWMAVVPGSSLAPAAKDTIYVTYTDFDFTVDPPRTAIEFVKSTDGGVTWSSTPLVIDEVTGDDKALQGSQVAVGPTGEIYVAWETYTYTQNGVDLSIKICKSTDGGKTFSPPKKVTDLVPAGTGDVFQGILRNGLYLQGLVVDTTSNPTKGNIYISFHGGGKNSQNDFLGIDGKYHFTDAFFCKSVNGGNTWSKPVLVYAPTKTKVDHFFPAMAQDKTGDICILYYGRNDSRNFLIDVFVASSSDGGKTWKNTKVSKKSFAPVTGWNDVFVNNSYMGDYLGIAADTSKTNDGCISAWGDNIRGDANILTTKTQ